jgi:phosphoglycolate phosphatase-like HAD superfamily hydrolase
MIIRGDAGQTIAFRSQGDYLSQPMTRLVLFDIDGTLVRTGGAGMKAFAKVFATEFNAHNGTEHLRFAGRTDVSLVREFFTLNHIPPIRENLARFFDRYVFWLDHILAQSETEACPGIWPFLRALQSLPEPPLLGLLTGNIQLGAEIKLRHFNLWQEFVTGAFADDHEDRDQIAHVALQRGARVLGAQITGHQVVVVGDTALDIRCGRAIGAKVLAVATGGHELDHLKSHAPDWAVPDLTAVSAREICG